MKKLIAIFVLLAGAGGGTWWYLNYGKPKEKPQVQTAAVSQQNIVEVVQATGALEAQRLVPVGSQVSGTVKELFVDYNSIVKKDQVIARLDPALLETKVAIANANIERAKNDIAQSRIQLENDQLNLDRMQAQYDKQMVAKQQLEASQLQVKSRQAQILSSEKGILQQEATLAEAVLNVKYCTIVSPVDGVVVQRMVDIGQAVQSSVNVAQFFTIATDLTSLRLTAGVDEADIGKVRTGMPVTFIVESYGQTQFSGTVEAVRLNATNSNNVVTYPVWIKVPNDDLKLRPSMTAQVRIIISTAEGALRIPNAALRFKPNKEIYAGLEVPEPAAGQGRRVDGGNAAGGDGRPGGQGANAGQQTANTPGAPAAAQPGLNGTPQNGGANQTAMNSQGRGGNQGGGRSGGRGNSNRAFGTGGSMNMTPEQLARMRGNNASGRAPGGGRSGGGGRNQMAGNTGGDTRPLTERNADKIDELMPESPRIIQRGAVWTWDEAKKELKSISVSYGITDGQFSELVSGDLKQGMQVVTGVILPVVNKPGAPGANPFMGGGQPNRGMGGMTPGGGPGGGGPGGGGGGRGGGGGGGGRGGGN